MSEAMEAAEAAEEMAGTVNVPPPAPVSVSWSPEKVSLIRRTVAKDLDEDEFALFVYVCRRTGLDPLARQIHPVKRWNSRESREVLSIQVGIDGFRLVAERTHCYAPGPETKYEEKDGRLVAATAYVKKYAGGEWHVVAATAHYDEFVQLGKNGQPSGLWAKMPHVMLGKCAEAICLRKAFPAELSGVYSDAEMMQASNAEPAAAVAGPFDRSQATGGAEASDSAGGPRVKMLAPSCPKCKATVVMDSKFSREAGGSWYCNKKRGGCGHNWSKLPSPSEEPGAAEGALALAS